MPHNVPLHDCTARILVSLAAGALLLPLPVAAAEKPVTPAKRPSPPMGWNSYTGYSIYVTEKELLKNIDFLSEKLLPYGYDTVTVDILECN